MRYARAWALGLVMGSAAEVYSYAASPSTELEEPIETIDPELVLEEDNDGSAPQQRRDGFARRSTEGLREASQGLREASQELGRATRSMRDALRDSELNDGAAKVAGIGRDALKRFSKDLNSIGQQIRDPLETETDIVIEDIPLLKDVDLRRFLGERIKLPPENTPPPPPPANPSPDPTSTPPPPSGTVESGGTAAGEGTRRLQQIPDFANFLQRDESTFEPREGSVYAGALESGLAGMYSAAQRNFEEAIPEAALEAVGRAAPRMKEGIVDQYETVTGNFEEKIPSSLSQPLSRESDSWDAIVEKGVEAGKKTFDELLNEGQTWAKDLENSLSKSREESDINLEDVSNKFREAATERFPKLSGELEKAHNRNTESVNNARDQILETAGNFINFEQSSADGEEPGSSWRGQILSRAEETGAKLSEKWAESQEQAQGFVNKLKSKTPTTMPESMEQGTGRIREILQRRNQGSVEGNETEPEDSVVTRRLQQQEYPDEEAFGHLDNHFGATLENLQGLLNEKVFNGELASGLENIRESGRVSDVWGKVESAAGLERGLGEAALGQGAFLERARENMASRESELSAQISGLEQRVSESGIGNLLAHRGEGDAAGRRLLLSSNDLKEGLRDNCPWCAAGERALGEIGFDSTVQLPKDLIQFMALIDNPREFEEFLAIMVPSEEEKAAARERLGSLMSVVREGGSESTFEDKLESLGELQREARNARSEYRSARRELFGERLGDELPDEGEVEPEASAAGRRLMVGQPPPSEGQMAITSVVESETDTGYGKSLWGGEESRLKLTDRFPGLSGGEEGMLGVSLESLGIGKGGKRRRDGRSTEKSGSLIKYQFAGGESDVIPLLEGLKESVLGGRNRSAERRHTRNRSRQ